MAASGKIPWRRVRQPSPVFLPGESHGQRILAGYTPWSLEELDTTVVTEHTQTVNTCDLPGGTVVKNLPAEADGDSGDLGSILGSGRSPGAGHGKLLQYSCLENSMDREAWLATVHGVADLDMTMYTHTDTARLTAYVTFLKKQANKQTNKQIPVFKESKPTYSYF